MKHRYVKAALVVLVAVLCMAQRPGYGGNTWQVKATLLTGTPVAVSAMLGNPPPASTTVYVCQGSISSNAGTSAKITITSGDGGQAWPAIAPLSTTAASVSQFWNASSSLACEWMPGGMLVSSDTGGIYFKASGVY